ncbi:phosphotransferase family protein [Saccharopolyspora griseoalba]|uniref:Phosphotransferase family protein n=1 Tax=Saccharopolyspora griseoalba TaxID=1431848 RepID=A0ABW2LMF8_9PSEU
MPRHEWAELPAGVRAAIEFRTGPVVSALSSPAGRNSELSVRVSTRDGQVLFCKGVRIAEEERARMHRHEARIAPYLPRIAPALLWSIEADGWLINGFEHVEGRFADLSPGSPDLPRLATAIDDFTAEAEAVLRHAPEDIAPSLVERWADLAAWRSLARESASELDAWERFYLHSLISWEHMALPLVDGTAVCHADLHELNILVGEEVRVIDWAWSRRAAPFVDLAILVTRLIAAGHTPRAAEAWAGDLRAWKRASVDAITACAVALLGVWEHELREEPGPQFPPLTDAARAWVQFRVCSTD